MMKLSPRLWNSAGLAGASACAAVILTLAPVPARAAEPNLPGPIMQQIAALQQAKEARTPAQRKLDSQLIYGIKMSRGEPVAVGVPTQRLDFAPDAEGRVVVDITATITDALVAEVQRLGGLVINKHSRFNAMRARMPLAQLETLAAWPGVRWIRPEEKAITNVGRLTSEGDFTHRAGLSRTNYSVAGAGIKIGVISDSVDFLPASQLSGDIPNITVLPGQSGVPGSGEGTAMLEIVADLVPKSQLYFATAFGSPAGFAQNILDLRAIGCDIIVDDVRYFNESPFQDDLISQAVNTVAADGALYFSSAGNSGNKNDGTSGTWEGDFNAGGSFTVGGGTWVGHSYGNTTFNTVPPGGGGARPFLYWSDPLGASTNDYDLFVINPAGNQVLASSTNPQNGTQDPYEAPLAFAFDGEHLLIGRSSGTARFLHLNLARGLLSFSTEGEVVGHAAAADGFGVAAVPISSAFPNAFVGGLANPVETFSSDGPRRMFYDPQGNPFTPGNFLATGGIVRQKPDIAAADGVKTTVPGFNPFFGTSAAAPHVAAIAALIKSYNPNLTPQQIRFALTNSALDIETSGFDRDAGWGIVMPAAALTLVPAPLPTLVSSNLSGGNLNGVIDLNECNELDLIIRNDAIDTATSVSATLFTTTPGVTINQPSSPYPNIPPGGTAQNLIPFRLYTASTFACGSAIDLAVVISSSAGSLTNNFRLSSGQVGSVPVTVANVSALAIPDDGTNFVEVPLNITNLFVPVGKVTVSVHIAHPADGDLTLQLIAPDGTTVDLARQRGGSDPNYGLSCAEPTIFDDAAANSITAGFAPFSGTFIPQQPLSAFAGKTGNAVNGTWRLRVRDSFTANQGTVQCVSLSLFPAFCTDGGGDCTADVAVSMTDAPDPVLVGSNLTYTILVTNLAPRVAPFASLTDTLPPGVTLVSFTTSRGSCSGSTGSVNCAFGTLPANGGALVRVVVRPIGPGLLTNNVSVTSIAGELNPANNVATTTTTVQLPMPVIVPFAASIVSESIVPATGGVDVGETVTINFALRNIGTRDTATNLTAKLLPTGGITVPSTQTNYGVLIANGAAISRPFTFTAVGTNYGSVTATFEIREGTNALGLVTFTFGLGGQASFVNQGVITIPLSGAANPYPSTINVSGIAGQVGKVTVVVSNLSHTWPEDIDMLLVSPTGQKVLLMADVGAVTNIGTVIPVNGITLTFDDDGGPLTTLMPTQIVSGVYRPTDYAPADTFPAPAPASPYGTSLSAFNGLNPNGVWSLYVFDDTSGDRGSIQGGWSVSIATIDPVNPRVDLGVGVVAAPNPVKLDSNLTYTVTVTNAGPEAAPAVLLTNILPAGVDFVSVTNSQGTCAHADGVVVCELGFLSASNGATVTVIGNVTTLGAKTFTASVSDAVVDLNQVNNTASATNSVSASADLVVALSASTNISFVNETVTYTVLVTNQGPNNAANVVLTDLLPTGVSLLSATPSRGSCTPTSAGVTCALGSMPNGSTATITIIGSTPADVDVLTNTVAISASSPTDPVPANNAATLFTTNLNPAFIIEASAANLVSESGPVTGGIDDGETVAINFYLRNVGTNSTTALIATLLTNDGVAAPGDPQDYGALLPNDSSVGRTNTFTALGTNGGLITVALRLQDGSVNLGTVTFTFALGSTITRQSFDTVGIPEFGPASPYPSTIAVSGLTGTVSKVTVTLTNLSHTYPDDIALLLTGPGNRFVMLMSGAGGGNPVGNLSLTFDDEAAEGLPDNTLISSGSYQPTRFSVLASLPAPAPVGPYLSSLAGFNGIDPNGDWSLYAYDDGTSDSGQILGGWSLSLTTVGLVQPQPAFLIASSMTPPGAFQLKVKGEPGGTYQIEASSDLLHWTPISTNLLTSDVLIFNDPQAGGSVQRFYRALRRP